MANRIPFWRGMTVLMGLVALAVALLLRRAGEPVFAPSGSDTVLGLGLGVGSWALAYALLPSLADLVPPIGDGLALVAGYAELQPLAWRYAGVLVIAPAEELFWRHYVPWLLVGRRGFARVPAQLVAAGAYAGLHLFSGSVWLALPALAFGTAWGLLTAWRGSPWAAICWHVSFDLLAFLWAPPHV